MRQPVAILLATLLLTLAIGLAQPVIPIPGSPYPTAPTLRVATLESSSRAGIEALVNVWLTNPANRFKRVIGPVHVTRDSANYEIIGSRGSVQNYVAAITYANP